MSVAFTEAWAVLKMGMPSMPSPPSDMGEKSPNGGGEEEYSHKDLDAEALIDFLVQTLGMEYQDAKVLVTHHKTKEMASASGSRVNKDAESLLRYGLPIPKDKEVSIYYYTVLINIIL